MKIDELIKELEAVKQEHGNIQVSVYGDTEIAQEVVVNDQPVKHISINGEL